MQCFRGLIFSILFLTMGTYMVYHSLNHCGIDSRDWPTADGVIVSVKKPVFKNQRAGVFIQYEYKVGDTVYSSKRVVCGNPGAKIDNSSKYIKGKKVSVFYNPSRPDVAVLEPGIPKSDLVEGVICILIGLFCILFAIYYARRHQEIIFAP